MPLPSRQLDYAPPAPAWSGAVSAAVGAMAVLWMAFGLALLVLADDRGEGARAMKLVLLACVPSTFVGLLLGLADGSRRARWAITGIALNGLVLLSAGGLLAMAWWNRLGALP